MVSICHEEDPYYLGEFDAEMRAAATCRPFTDAEEAPDAATSDRRTKPLHPSEHGPEGTERTEETQIAMIEPGRFAVSRAYASGRDLSVLNDTHACLDRARTERHLVAAVQEPSKR